MEQKNPFINSNKKRQRTLWQCKGEWSSESNATSKQKRMPAYFVLRVVSEHPIEFSTEFCWEPPNKTSMEVCTLNSTLKSKSLPQVSLVADESVLLGHFVTKDPKLLEHYKQPQAEEIPQQLKQMTNLLKSQVQKCVRRGIVNLAMQSTRQWLHLDAVDCLRRLPIIMVEDTQLLPKEMSVLVWWMCFYSHFPSAPINVNFSLVVWLLQLVGTLAAWTNVNRFNLSETIPMLSDVDIAKSDPLLWAIKIRHDFGGMKGDQNLLRAAMLHHYQQHSKKNTRDEVDDDEKKGEAHAEESKWKDVWNNLYEPALTIEKLNMWQDNKWPRELQLPVSADFHVYSQVIDKLLACKMQVPKLVADYCTALSKRTQRAKRGLDYEVLCFCVWHGLSKKTTKTEIITYSPIKEKVPADVLLAVDEFVTKYSKMIELQQRSMFEAFQ